MAEITKSTYQDRALTTWSKENTRKVGENSNPRFNLSKNLLLGFGGIAFMTIWLILSIQTENLLMGEIIPAYIIITALLFMRALDNPKV